MEIRGRLRGCGRGGIGQSIAEFALVWPIFVVVVLALIEFSVGFGCLLRVNFASRDASLLGAEAGDRAGGDCLMLRSVDQAMGAPASPNRIVEIVIYKADRNGASLASNVWSRGGSTDCAFNGDAFTVPYTETSNGYPESSRCNTLAGCSGQPLDTIGIRITYDYQFVTPLGVATQLLGGTPGSDGWTFTQSNQMRMEPVL